MQDPNRTLLIKHVIIGKNIRNVRGHIGVPEIIIAQRGNTGIGIGC